jgi:hypothetical protein
MRGYFVHPFDDDRFIAGNGTIGLEILEDLPMSTPSWRRSAAAVCLRHCRGGRRAQTRHANLRSRAGHGGPAVRLVCRKPAGVL